MANYHTYTMYLQIKAPAEKYVFVEDCDTRTTNIGCWEIDLTGPNWDDVPAIWHYNKSNLGFADGHAETHKWMDKQTIQLCAAKNPQEFDSLNKHQPGNQDLIYMQQHYGVLGGRN